MTKKKTHQTIQVTKKMLKQMMACDDGLKAVSRLLPVTLSTDPDENVDAAVALCSLHRVDVEWFVGRVTGRCMGTCCSEEMRDYREHSGESCDGAQDPMVAAQMLAWAVDCMVSEEGR